MHGLGIINSDPAMVYVSIRKERYSNEIIRKYKEYVINLTNENLVYETDFCGVKSGRDIDKFETLKLTKEPANFVKCPLIKESPVSIECKVKEIREFGTHDMFIAEVLSIDADEEYIEETGKFDISKCNLISYLNGNYYKTGEKLGKFGFSVQKKK